MVREQSPRVGVGVIVMRGMTVLLGLRRGNHGGGTWAFPGGKMMFGESIAECAARELAEETGMTPGRPRIVGVTNDLFPESALHYVTVYVAMAGVGGEAENREPAKCEGWDWFAHDRLPAPLFGPTQQLVTTGVLDELAVSQDRRVRTAGFAGSPGGSRHGSAHRRGA